jgi:hypothetical protein
MFAASTCDECGHNVAHAEFLEEEGLAIAICYTCVLCGTTIISDLRRNNNGEL